MNLIANLTIAINTQKKFMKENWILKVLEHFASIYQNHIVHDVLVAIEFYLLWVGNFITVGQFPFCFVTYVLIMRSYESIIFHFVNDDEFSSSDEEEAVTSKSAAELKKGAKVNKKAAASKKSGALQEIGNASTLQRAFMRKGRSAHKMSHDASDDEEGLDAEFVGAQRSRVLKRKSFGSTSHPSMLDSMHDSGSPKKPIQVAAMNAVKSDRMVITGAHTDVEEHLPGTAQLKAPLAKKSVHSTDDALLEKTIGGVRSHKDSIASTSYSEKYATFREKIFLPFQQIRNHKEKEFWILVALVAAEVGFLSLSTDIFALPGAVAKVFN
jgi:hypothetical protein